MKIRQILKFSIPGFLIGIAILAVAQYFVTDNIRQLIHGNEALIVQYKQGNRLISLEKDVRILDYRLKAALVSGDSEELDGLREEIQRIKSDLDELNGLKVAGVPSEKIMRLDRLIGKKVLLSQVVLNEFQQKGFAKSQLNQSDTQSKIISQEIASLVHAADTSGRTELARKIEVADHSGQQVLRWNLIVTLLILMFFIGLFLFILNRLRKQEILVNQLNTSELKLKNAALVKENFLANMSHEIRTPLNVILGYTNLLQRKKLDDEAILYVDTVKQSGETLLNVVNDILDLSKIESGMMHIEENDFSLSTLIHSVKTMFQQKIDEKGLSFDTLISPVTPDILVGDSTRLTQILVNLIGNAVKFTPNGGILLEISGEGNSSEQVELKFKLTDTGIGIEPHKLDTIFERFRQAEDSTTRQYGGTGLGLSIVQDLVHLQNGTVSVASKPGAGTTVTFSIPYKISETEENVVKPEPVPEEGLAKNLRVLVAEDNEINRGLMERFLREWGIESVLAYNGKEAVELVKSHPFDLVFMDIQMPVMDGYTATQLIRETLHSDIPIIAMTAHAMAGDREKCLSFGMNEHIPKPIREKDLYSLIQQFGKKVTASATPGSPASSPAYGSFQIIDLGYMREISGGDIDYEKLVTGQFLEQLPLEIAQLKQAFETGQTNELRMVAHNMKTTISIMGLNALLDNSLEALECSNENVSELRNELNRVLAVSQAAMTEARDFNRDLEDTFNKSV